MTEIKLKEPETNINREKDFGSYSTESFLPAISFLASSNACQQTT